MLTSPAMVLILAWAPASPSESNSARRGELDLGLSQAVLNIRKGFVTHRAEPILPLIPVSSKVYLSVRPIASDKDFYSRDQMQSLLQKAFSRLTTLEFRVRLDRVRGTDEGEGVIVCPATWAFEKSGVRKEIRLRFVLSRAPQGWILKEIREIH